MSFRPQIKIRRKPENEPIKKKEYKANVLKFLLCFLVVFLIYCGIIYTSLEHIKMLPKNDITIVVVYVVLVVLGIFIFYTFITTLISNVGKRLVIYPDSLEYFNGKHTEKVLWERVSIVAIPTILPEALYSASIIAFPEKNFVLDNLFFNKYELLFKLINTAALSSKEKQTYNL